MCLTIPKKVISKKGEVFIVEKNGGERQEVKSIISARVGDFILTQNNVIIQKLSKKQAQDLNALFNQ